MSGESARLRLLNAVASAAPTCGQMFANVREGAAVTRNDKTSPPIPQQVSGSASRVTDGETNPIEAAVGARERAAVCGDVREGASVTARAGDETKPMKPAGDATPARQVLTARQVAAARLLALGRCGRAVAAEVGVNEHTVTRWRRTVAFAAEVGRQHGLILAEQVRQGHARQVDAHAAVAQRVARQYGLTR